MMDTLGLRGWGVGDERRARVGGFGLPAKNRAAKALFRLTKRGGWLECISADALTWQNVGLRWWEGAIEQHARGWADSPQKQKTEPLWLGFR